MTVEPLTDAKPTDDSSASDPDDANALDSSSDESEGIKQTFDIIDEALDAEDNGEDSPDLEQSDLSEKDQSQESEDDTTEETENTDDKPENIEDELPSEFHEHPRFKELIEQKNQFKEETETLKSQITELESKAQYFDALGEEALTDYVSFIQKSNDNPMEAIKQIQPLLENLAQRAGLRLSPDLQDQVESGELTKEEAMARQKLQSENKSLKDKQSMQEQVQQQAMQQAIHQERVNVAVNWESQKQNLDPDFAKVNKIFSNIVLADFTKNGWPDKDKIPARLDELYNDMKSQIGTSGKPQEKKVVKGSPTPKGKEKKVYGSSREIIDDLLD